MIRQDLSQRGAELRAARVPFVHARVIYAQAPTSAKPGDEAIIHADGSVEGFVGGDCAQASVTAVSMEVLPSGRPALLRITPEPEPGQPGKRVVHNPCLSGGTLEVFLEPCVPPPLVQVVGGSPTARALADIGRSLGYAMSGWDGRVHYDAAAFVVASHGGDEAGPIAAALDAGVPYVGLVASAKRGASVIASLEVDGDTKARVRSPAGLDIGAGTAEEIALSILAEIVSCQPRAPRPGRPLVESVCMAVDPVCGMSVIMSQDALSCEHPDPSHAGTSVWFCGPGCRKAFLADPVSYPLSASS